MPYRLILPSFIGHNARITSSSDCKIIPIIHLNLSRIKFRQSLRVCLNLNHFSMKSYFEDFQQVEEEAMRALRPMKLG